MPCPFQVKMLKSLPLSDINMKYNNISMNNLNHMGYIVPFLTISSILIDICFYRLIFIGAMFNSYNY